jgi:hypothetical protein
MKNIIILLILAVPFFSCKKIAQHDLNTDEQFYFKGYINGQYTSWSLSSNPQFKTTYGGGFSYRNDNNNNLYFVYYQNGSSIEPVPGIADPAPGLDSQGVGYRDTSSISIFFITPNKPSTFNSVLNYFLPGDKKFATISINNPDSISQGISILYSQNTGYLSGFGDQSTSSFQSIELKDAPAGKEYTKIWTAKFSCKVYQPYGGNDPGYHPTQVIEIKDAEIHVPLFHHTDYF